MALLLWLVNLLIAGVLAWTVIVGLGAGNWIVALGSSLALVIAFLLAAWMSEAARS